ncbi:MAG: hypothetical protein ACR2MB_01595 [Acidimicrobiales bacterium]
MASAKEDVPVVLVQLEGHFTSLRHGPRPVKRNAPPVGPPTGTVLDIAVEARTGEALDIGQTHKPADLSRLGTVHPTAVELT